MTLGLIGWIRSEWAWSCCSAAVLMMAIISWRAPPLWLRLFTSIHLCAAPRINLFSHKSQPPTPSPTAALQPRQERQQQHLNWLPAASRCSAASCDLTLSHYLEPGAPGCLPGVPALHPRGERSGVAAWAGLCEGRGRTACCEMGRFWSPEAQI